ncbi:hypothetical protein GJU40_03015 [Bacillus lacus]|uniref:Uncharacterized protein n=1 Tax=Metabacillus lacus TaxID=1983721 RepID=A0A7X2IWV4_9BACI|nr:hypothetical protein [Metabacillus lacus]MRX71141.1 hypothetical protein [Metabacillus lacus]
MSNTKSDVLFQSGAFGGIDDYFHLKESHDRYDVYVNHDYVGQKTLFNAQEHIRDIEDFLHHEGYHQFQTSTKGNQFYINAEGRDEAIAHILKVYLSMR